MKKEEFEKQYELVLLDEKDFSLIPECIDYNWGKIKVKNKQTGEITFGVKGKPWTKQTDETSMEFHPDIEMAPIIRKPVLYTASVQTAYALNDSKEAETTLKLMSHTPKTFHWPLANPAFLNQLSLTHASGYVQLTYDKLRSHVAHKSYGTALYDIIHSKYDISRQSYQHSAWDVYRRTHMMHNKHLNTFPKANVIEDIFNVYYSQLIHSCVSTKNFHRILYHSQHGKEYPIWDKLGFIIPDENLFKK